MKKVLSVILALAMIFSFAACGRGSEEQKDPRPDESAFAVNGHEFRLDTEKEFKGLKYRVSGDFKEAEHDEFIPYIQYNFLQEDDSNLLFFRIFYYKGKGLDEAKTDLGLEQDIQLTDGKNDGLDYRMYAQQRDDGGTIHYYVITKEGDTYVVNFVSKYDIADFEQKVVKSLKF